ncbi:hypothetical protein PU560_03910 [Georgenia sp. 10Sc9-8]|uniref:PASTA domain-containing protein n=1 Tax=Georgenia halotolerans TaxID=3028317 RepID=A0ABT5TU74_9MICO|nr:hypothetical protein [Georgenia halotolerans]
MNKSTARRVLAAAALVPVLTGCGGDVAEPDGTEPTGTAPPIDAPTLPEESAPPDVPEAPDDPPGAGAPVEPPPGRGADPGGESAEMAVQDLADRLGVPAEDVTVVRAESVTWPDGALGCPEPGTAYTQSLVEGMLIELTVDGETYRYHSGTDREPFLCSDPQEPVRSEG